MAPLVPFAKLAALAARQLAKPVSQILIRYTLNHPEAKQRVLDVGQILNRVNVRIGRLAEGKQSSKQILELSDEKALDTGATFLGEIFVFSVGAFVITQELIRSNRKSWALELQKQEEASAKELQINSQYHEASRRILLLEESLTETRLLLQTVLHSHTKADKTSAPQDKSSEEKKDDKYDLQRLIKSSLSSIDSI